MIKKLFLNIFNLIYKLLFIFSNLSRHKRELALCVKPNSTETKLLAFALSCKANDSSKPDARPIDHPIHNLSQIHDDQFSHLNASPIKTSKLIRRKRRQLLQSLQKPIEVILYYYFHKSVHYYNLYFNNNLNNLNIMINIWYK